jgi:hypothetical protein
MIAFRDNLPVVRFGDGLAFAFERAWLCGALVRAAERAGYRKWWLASHVTESVTNYLEQDFEDPVICEVRLEKAVRSVLEVIGYSDVAGQFRVEPPPARISLEDLARDAGYGYELAFFDLLRGRLREVLSGRAERLEICDAHRGIKLLRSAKSWRRDCSGLLEEVVGFVRREVVEHAAVEKVELQLS